MKRNLIILLALGLALPGSSLADKVKFDELPDPVKKAVRAHVGSSNIEDIDRETRGGRRIYEVAFKKDGQHTELQFSEDGTVLNAPAAQVISKSPDILPPNEPLAGAVKVTIDQVPAAVRASIRAQAGDAEIEDIDKGTLNGKTVYQAAFKKAGQHTELRLSEDGTLLNANAAPNAGLSRNDLLQYQFNELPRSVQDTVRAHIGNSRLIDIDRESWNGKPVYEVEFLRNGRQEQLLVAHDGTLVQEPNDQIISRAPASPRPESRKLTMNQLPIDVQNTIRAHAGRSQIEDIDMRTDGGENVYQAAYKRNGVHTELLVAQDGTVLSVQRPPVGAPVARPETGRGRAIDPQLASLPAAVQNAVRKRVGNNRLDKIDKETIRGQTYYEVEFNRNGRKEEFHVRDDGVILELMPERRGSQ